MDKYYKTACYLTLIVLLNACGGQGDGVTLEGQTMGTTYAVIISGAPEVDRQVLQSGVRQHLEAINRSMSTYIEDSEISRINRSRQSDWIDLSEELHTVISKAMEISHLTNGAFDITIGPLVNLWGFGPGGGDNQAPAAAEIRTMLEQTGYDKLKIGLSPPSIKKVEPRLYLDLSAIGKGYAVDEIAEFLKSKEITDYMVDIGGEIRVSGNNPDGGAWRIGIEKPLSRERSVQRIVELRNIGMATSGDYRNYFEQDGRRYSHTIDPRTGYPIRHTLASVSVLHNSAMTADALATALLVMGPTEGLDFASRNDLPAFFIIKNEAGFIERHTRAFDRYMKDDPS